MITTTGEPKLHWNYFTALESDLEVAARYIEFSEANYDVYSIELAHLLFAAASEVDVIAKALCKRLQPGGTFRCINDYHSPLMSAFPSLPCDEVFIPRYAIRLKPWDEWSNPPDPKPHNPFWWRDYNMVKHHRNDHFQKANLKNVLNAMGGLMLLAFQYYSHVLSTSGRYETMIELMPESTLLRFPPNWYRM
jgi:hypothetical protein